MIEKIFFYIKKLIPENWFKKLQPVYHYFLALVSALIYRFPSRKIKVIGITGTKGKTSTIEILNAILEESGYKTALGGTLRFKIGDDSESNMFKMTMPGRFVVQSFLRKAVSQKCTYAILEMTSQGTVQYRHKFIELDGLIFTNLAPEHIESHGSFENYLAAKLEIAKALEKSGKPKRVIVSNADDKYGSKFLEVDVPEKYTYSLKDAKPFTLKEEGLIMTIGGKSVESRLSGEFNIYNILAATTFARSQGISDEIIRRAIEKFTGIRGRVEKIELDPENPLSAKQDFKVIVDYAHTPDSLEKLYQVFQNSKRICVLGNTGGGRDKWKRKEMARIANDYCTEVILTDEDPYDEDPQTIVNEMAEMISDSKCVTIMDRREAIRHAISDAKTGDAVLITGKGTDPYIMQANGKKEPWSDAKVAREELEKVLGNR